MTLTEARIRLKATLETFAEVTNAQAGVVLDSNYPTLQSIVSLSTLTGVKISDMTSCLKLAPAIIACDVSNIESMTSLTKVLLLAIDQDKAYYDLATVRSQRIAKDSMLQGLLDNPNPDVKDLMGRLTDDKRS